MAESGALTAAQQEKLEKAAQWLVETCLLWGTETHTAYLVAGEFTKGLAREWTRRDQGAAPEKKEGEDG